MKTPSAKLRKAIESAGITYRTLEEKTGISRSALQRYASGTTTKIPMEAVTKISEVLNISPTYIMGWEDEVKPIPDPNWKPEITKKDERDIEKELEALLAGTSSKGNFAAYGGKQPSEMSKEEYADHILFENALKEALTIAKKINKEKHTPHKHRGKR